MAPDWIEQDKEIRRDLNALESWFAQQAQWQRTKRARLKRLAPDKMIAERERLAHAREQTCAEYRRRAAALNRTIDVFNLKAPSAELHREWIRVEEEIQKFRDACSA